MFPGCFAVIFYLNIRNLHYGAFPYLGLPPCPQLQHCLEELYAKCKHEFPSLLALEELFRKDRLHLIVTSSPVTVLSLSLPVDDSFSLIAGQVFYALLLNRHRFPAGCSCLACQIISLQHSLSLCSLYSLTDHSQKSF